MAEILRYRPMPLRFPPMIYLYSPIFIQILFFYSAVYCKEGRPVVRTALIMGRSKLEFLSTDQPDPMDVFKTNNPSNAYLTALKTIIKMFIHLK